MLDAHDQFGLGSYVMMFLGQNVPYENQFPITPPERAMLDPWLAKRRHMARTAATAEQGLALVRHPGWTWGAGYYVG